MLSFAVLSVFPALSFTVTVTSAPVLAVNPPRFMPLKLHAFRLLPAAGEYVFAVSFSSASLP